MARKQQVAAAVRRALLTGALTAAGAAPAIAQENIGEIVVNLYEPESERSRGVIGLGEPPVISPGGAISNAVANALGVRVPVLPMTPDRVLAALAKNKKVG